MDDGSVANDGEVVDLKSESIIKVCYSIGWKRMRVSFGLEQYHSFFCVRVFYKP